MCLCDFCHCSPVCRGLSLPWYSEWRGAALCQECYDQIGAAVMRVWKRKQRARNPEPPPEPLPPPAPQVSFSFANELTVWMHLPWVARWDRVPSLITLCWRALRNGRGLQQMLRIAREGGVPVASTFDAAASRYAKEYTSFQKQYERKRRPKLKRRKVKHPQICN